MTRPRAPAGGIDLISLRLLLAVSEEGNLARAAAREHIAPSAASRRISNLEARLGVRLLHRHDRGAEVTDAAKRVLPRIRAVFDLLDQTIDELADTRDGLRGLVRVQAHTTAAAGVFPAKAAAFLAQHPNIEVAIDEASSLDIVHAVTTGACDLGLIAGTVPAGGLTLIPWAVDALVAVLPAGHPLAAQATLTLAAMVDSPFICMQRDSALLALFQSQAAVGGSVLSERAHVASFETACRMVGLGLGVAILPGNSAHPAAEASGAVVRTLDEPWAQRPLMLCLRDPNRASVATRLLVDFLLDRTIGQ